MEQSPNPGWYAEGRKLLSSVRIATTVRADRPVMSGCRRHGKRSRAAGPRVLCRH